MAIDDYPYEGVYLWEDLELALPAGTAWGDIGKKKYFNLFNFLDFKNLISRN